jgi:hypothetical protein
MTTRFEPRHYNLTGMGLEETIATSMRAFDERVEELVIHAGELCREHGGDEAEVEFFMQMQRSRLEPEREAFHKKLRLAFEHGCKELH